MLVITRSIKMNKSHTPSETFCGGHKFCKEQSFLLTPVQRKTLTNLHRSVCGESTVATLLLTEETQELSQGILYKFFKSNNIATLIMLLLQPGPQRKDTQALRLVASSIVFWKKALLF